VRARSRNENDGVSLWIGTTARRSPCSESLGARGWSGTAWAARSLAFIGEWLLGLGRAGTVGSRRVAGCSLTTPARALQTDSMRRAFVGESEDVGKRWGAPAVGGC
jgi:hypothetical protein